MKQQNSTYRFWASLKHAFAIPQAEQPSPEERRWLEQVAERVVKRRLSAPAVLMLQSAKPINFLGSQLLAFFKPIISMVLPAEKCDQAAELLSKRESIETLARMIEEREQRNRRPEGRPKEPATGR